MTTDATTHPQGVVEADPNDTGSADDELAQAWAEFDEADDDSKGAAASADEADPENDAAAAAGNADDADKARAGAQADADKDIWESDTDGARKQANRQPDAQASGRGQQQRGAGTAADIWSTATPELLAEKARWEARDVRLRGQVSALQRQLNELSASRPRAAGSTAAAPNGGAAADQQQADDAAAADDFFASEDWKKFEDEYGEVAAPMRAAILARESRLTRLEKELQAIGTDRRQQALEEQDAALTTIHPDWRDVIGSRQAEFKAWVDAQPRHIRDAAYRNASTVVDAEEAADVVGRFKAFVQASGNGNGGGQGTAGNRPNGGIGSNHSTRQPLDARRQRQLDSAKGVRTRTPSMAPGIPEDADEETIWKAFDRAERVA